jgi:hypothetical protein
VRRLVRHVAVAWQQLDGSTFEHFLAVGVAQLDEVRRGWIDAQIR